MIQSFFLVFTLALGSVEAKVEDKISLDKIFSSPAAFELCAATVRAPKKSVGRGPFRKTHPPSLFFDKGSDQVFASQRTAVDKKIVSRIFRFVGDDLKLQTLVDFDEEIFDIFVDGDELYALSAERVFVVDKVSGKTLRDFPTHREKAFRPTIHSRAYALQVVGSKILVAHGVLGLRALDKQSGEIRIENPLNTRQASGHISKAIEIIALNKYAAIVMDNITLPLPDLLPFNGILKYNLESDKVEGKSESNRRYNGVLSNARGVIFGQRLYLNNFGSLQIYELTSVGQTDLIARNFFSLKHQQVPFPIDGSDEDVVTPEEKRARAKASEYIPLLGQQILGEILVDSQNVYGCLAKGDIAQPFAVAISSWK